MTTERDFELKKEADFLQIDTGSLAHAAKVVYKRYGKDLSAFFRDAYEAEARKRHSEIEDDSNCNLEVCV